MTTPAVQPVLADGDCPLIGNENLDEVFEILLQGQGEEWQDLVLSIRDNCEPQAGPECNSIGAVNLACATAWADTLPGTQSALFTTCGNPQSVPPGATEWQHCSWFEGGGSGGGLVNGQATTIMSGAASRVDRCDYPSLGARCPTHIAPQWASTTHRRNHSGGHMELCVDVVTSSTNPSGSFVTVPQARACTTPS